MRIRISDKMFVEVTPSETEDNKISFMDDNNEVVSRLYRVDTYLLQGLHVFINVLFIFKESAVSLDYNPYSISEKLSKKTGSQIVQLLKLLEFYKKENSELDAELERQWVMSRIKAIIEALKATSQNQDQFDTVFTKLYELVKIRVPVGEKISEDFSCKAATLWNLWDLMGVRYFDSSFNATAVELPDEALELDDPQEFRPTFAEELFHEQDIKDYLKKLPPPLLRWLSANLQDLVDWGMLANDGCDNNPYRRFLILSMLKHHALLSGLNAEEADEESEYLPLCVDLTHGLTLCESLIEGALREICPRRASAALAITAPKPLSQGVSKEDAALTC